MLKTTLLFIATALAEIIGCFLPNVWLRKGRAAWLLLPAAASLALFVWLPLTGSGQVSPCFTTIG